MEFYDCSENGLENILLDFERKTNQFNYTNQDGELDKELLDSDSLLIEKENTYYLSDDKIKDFIQDSYTAGFSNALQEDNYLNYILTLKAKTDKRICYLFHSDPEYIKKFLKAVKKRNIFLVYSEKNFVIVGFNTKDKDVTSIYKECLNEC